MNEHDESPHDPLLDELRNLFALDDPVPPLVTQTAKAAIGWRRIDAELAELLADSAVDADSLAFARGAGATLRSASFSAGALTIDVEIHGEGADRRVVGQLSPPARAMIELQTADETAPATTESDKLGRFRIGLPAASSIRLRVATGEDPDRPSWIETSWIAI
jgi:hypothetical protein